MLYTFARVLAAVHMDVEDPLPPAATRFGLPALPALGYDYKEQLGRNMSGDDYTAPPAPRKGDILFRGDLPDWHNNACLNYTPDGDQYGYTEGCRRGARQLVQYVNENAFLSIL